MRLDAVIRSGTVVDGTGADGVVADVGIAGGRVVAVDPGGRARLDAPRTIDAGGLVVAPGFVDVHTHFDAQVFWDPACTPSIHHGVTSAFGGNCGFSVAPLRSGDRYLMRLLARVEGIPLPALETGVPWSWRGFGEYLDAVTARRPALNFGALAGHSALRRAVMGERMGADDPSDAEIAAMCSMLERALAEGAAGFSSSWAATHVDGDGNPVPSRAAPRHELLALCSVLEAFPGTQVEFIPTNGAYEDRHVELMADMAAAACAPLNWNILVPRGAAFTQGRLRSADVAAARGVRVVGLSYPDVIRSRISFLSSGFDSIPGWAAVMALPVDRKIAALADPGVRAELRAGAEVARSGALGGLTRFEAFVIGETFAAATDGLAGRTVGEVAAERGADPLDVLLDVALADGLRTGLVPPPGADDEEAWALRTATWSDPRVVIGASDAGAHLDMLTTFDYPVRFLALTRSHAALSLEAAVHRLTAVPAALYGLVDRGLIAQGMWADLVVFDPVTVDAGPVEWRDDLPGGAGRLYAEPVGVAHVLVNGTEVVRAGRLTGERPGRVLRSGTDTADLPGRG